MSVPAGACSISSAWAASKRNPAAEPKIGHSSPTVSDPAAALPESPRSKRAPAGTGTTASFSGPLGPRYCKATHRAVWAGCCFARMR
jgi:hypothetical protein